VRLTSRLTAAIEINQHIDASNVQWRRSGWNSGGRRGGIQKACVGRRVGYGEGYPCPPGEGVWGGDLAPPQKNFFHLKWRF